MIQSRTTSIRASEVEVRGWIPQLDGLRGIAILLVILHHFWPKAGPLTKISSLAHVGWIGVDLFFVISGFLICGILLDTRDRDGYFRNFYARRALRIFPLYYLFLAAMAIAIPALQKSSEFFDQSGSVWWYVLYGGNIREAIVGHEPAYVLAPLWSLSIEEQFYILFPLLVRRLEIATLWKVLWGIVTAAPMFRIVTFLLEPQNERIQYLATFSRMDTIALGCLLATGLRLGRVNVSAGTSARMAAVGLSVTGVVFFLGGLNRMELFCRLVGYSLTAFAFAAIVLWAVAARPMWLTCAPLMHLGKICYGVYLLQRPSQVVLGKLLGAGGYHLGPTTRLFADAAFAIVVAIVSWHVFEKHCLKLKRYFASPTAASRPSLAQVAAE